jgi:hypothetical protein
VKKSPMRRTSKNFVKFDNKAWWPTDQQWDQTCPLIVERGRWTRQPTFYSWSTARSAGVRRKITYSHAYLSMARSGGSDAPTRLFMARSTSYIIILWGVHMEFHEPLRKEAPRSRAAT